jgi:hypothetical protein
MPTGHSKGQPATVHGSQNINQTHGGLVDSLQWGEHHGQPIDGHFAHSLPPLSVVVCSECVAASQHSQNSLHLGHCQVNPQTIPGPAAAAAKQDITTCCSITEIHAQMAVHHQVRNNHTGKASFTSGHYLSVY